MKTIQIPDRLYDTILSQLKESPFSSLNDFITYIIQQYADTASEIAEPDTDEEIKKRLENLGYL